MKFKQNKGAAIALFTLMVAIQPTSWAYDSGSTEVDGSFSPVVNTELTLPADGIFNFTNVDIPAGVTVTFAKNAANTPVTILASGNINIAGSINIGGGDSADVGSAGDGNTGDDAIPGIGGPGGFDGGQAGIPGDILGSAGYGPGGGNPAKGAGITSNQFGYIGRGCGGEGGSFAVSGQDSRAATNEDTRQCNILVRASGSLPYGSPTLLPLIGGSGGGGASSGDGLSGSGGGGGGGALLIASSGTVSIIGSIDANGGDSGASNGGQAGGTGGGGAGGAIRIIATTIEGNGSVTATGGLNGAAFGTTASSSAGGVGSEGRIRFESETFTRTASTTPAFTFSQPGEIFVAGMPALTITSVAGVTAPAVPTGNSDIVLPEATPNPITVTFATSAVPLGNTVTLKVTPNRGETVIAVSSAIAGSEANGTASATVAIPDGPSTLSAEVSYTVTIAMGEDLSRYTDGVMVASVRLTHDAINGAQTRLITVDGKEHIIPQALNRLTNAS